MTVNPTTLSVAEGGSSSYTVVLTSQPTGNVTVTPSRTGSSDVTVSSAPLTFTPTNWSTARTVTVAATAGYRRVERHGDSRARGLRGGLRDGDGGFGGGDGGRRRDSVDGGGAVGGSRDALGERGGDGTVTVTATLNQAPRDVATVLTLSVGESSDTAVEGTDYATVSNVLLTINANQTTGTATFQLNPTDDDLDEDDESVTSRR